MFWHLIEVYVPKMNAAVSFEAGLEVSNCLSSVLICLSRPKETVGVVMVTVGGTILGAVLTLLGVVVVFSSVSLG